MKHVALVISLLALASGCTCVNDATSGGAEAGSGGQGGSATGGGAGGGVAGTLALSPVNVTLDVDVGGSAWVQFTATLDGQPASPTWLASPASIGVIDGTGRFVASGQAGGVATVTASLAGQRVSTTVMVRLHLTQDGAVGSTGPGAGGVGGVGGEGPGAAVSAAVATVLRQTPTAVPGLTLLYPYDETVWPKDILPPLLQWRGAAKDPEAVAIHLECPAFVYDGTFARTATPFTHHPITAEAWKYVGEACAGHLVSLRVVFAADGAAWGPLTARWTIAPGNLKGVIYYNSYGTKLAYNYGGALGGDGRFGGATLAIKGKSTDPVLVAGGTGGADACRVCHVVSGDGSALLSQRGDSYGATAHYALKQANAETAMAPADGRFAWGGVTYDGTRLFSNAAPLVAAATAPSKLYSVPTGAELPTTGLPTDFRAGTPVFSADDGMVAFLWWSGDVAGATADQRSLALMKVAGDDFSDFKVLHTPPAGQMALYPSFMPNNRGVVFEVETESNGRDLGGTRSRCDNSSNCSDVGARGELWWVDVATGQARRLDAANGVGHAPTGPEGHNDDATLNYEPSVAPIPSGGYAWVIFTSRRLYGNVATINPYWSDPRYHDISQTPTPKKLWVAAIDLNAAPGADPSHPAFYLPAQELLAGNSRGYWALEPCLADGLGCESGDQCCGGFCRGEGEGAPLECRSSGGGCSQEFERCEADADCCGGTCTNRRCINEMR